MSFFILSNTNNIILKLKGSKKCENFARNSFIKTGICFSENLSGTNAVALASKLQRGVYTLPEHHYCSFLKQWHLFSVPLYMNNKFEGCLTFASFQDSISNEKLLITELLNFIISNELKIIMNNLINLETKAIHLTKKQVDIINMIASGKTDISTAIEKGISLGTVRYHKTNIFKKLDVESSTQAVIKALKLNLISLEDINI